MKMRTQMIKDALECNEVQAIIYDNLMGEIDDKDLIDFFKF